ncbi:hypothetical protein VPH35_099892 [Triticum aestivum]
MGSSFGLVDFRGRPVDTSRHGGVRASMFIYIMVWLGNVVNIANSMNMVSYLRGTMNMGVAAAATTSTNFVAALQMFTIPAAFLADSYVKRFYTVLIFAPVEILGYILLAIQAHVPSLHPPACSVNEPHNCEPVHGTNLSLLLLGMYMICIGEGAIRACLPALGGDQFDNADAVERRLESSFFNWSTFFVSMGTFFGLIFVVWLENNKGWGVGFGVCAAIVLLGLLIWAAGFPFYRNQVPTGSPITRIMQPWSLYNVTQVEETKIMCRMIPIFVTSALGYMPVSIILNLTVQRGNTMDTRLGAIVVSPATLFVIPTVFQLVILVVYDRLLVPLLRRATGYVGGVTHLQRIGVGFVAAVLASAVAALVETRRKGVARRSSFVDSPAGGEPMSVFWLTPQFFLLRVVDVTSFVGLLEFFYSEAFAGMKSIGSSVFYCMLGLAAWFSTLLIQLVNRAMRRGGGAAGWLDGANLNRSRLDSFYWLVCVPELVSFMVYLFWARRYVYRNDQRVAAEDDKKTIPSAAYVDGI